MTVKNIVRLVLSVGVSFLFLRLAFRNVDMAQVVVILRQVRLGYVALYCLALACVQLFRALRWGILTRPFAPMSAGATWRISNIGGMMVMLLPLRLGEFARPLLMKRASGASFTSSMAASMVERVLDGLLIVLLFFASTTQVRPPYAVTAELNFAAQVALAFFLGVLVVLLMAMFLHARLVAVVHRLTRSITPALGNRLMLVIDAFVAGLRALPDAKSIAALVAWTFAYWAANGLGLYWLFCAFKWELPFVAASVLVCVLVIGIMIPAGPGMLGTYQGALVAGLAIFGISQTAAAAYGLVAYPLNLAVVVGFGAPYLLGRGKLQLSELWRATQGATSDGAPAAGAPH